MQTAKEKSQRVATGEIKGTHDGDEGREKGVELKLRIESLTQFNVRRVRRQIDFRVLACHRRGWESGKLGGLEHSTVSDTKNSPQSTHHPTLDNTSSSMSSPKSIWSFRLVDRSAGARTLQQATTVQKACDRCQATYRVDVLRLPVG